LARSSGCVITEAGLFCSVETHPGEICHDVVISRITVVSAGEVCESFAGFVETRGGSTDVVENFRRIKPRLDQLAVCLFSFIVLLSPVCGVCLGEECVCLLQGHFIRAGRCSHMHSKQCEH